MIDLITWFGRFIVNQPNWSIRYIFDKFDWSSESGESEESNGIDKISEIGGFVDFYSFGRFGGFDQFGRFGRFIWSIKNELTKSTKPLNFDENDTIASWLSLISLSFNIPNLILGLFHEV